MRNIPIVKSVSPIRTNIPMRKLRLATFQSSAREHLVSRGSISGWERYELASGLVVAALNLSSSPIGDQMSVIEYPKSVSDAPGAMHIMSNDDEGHLTLCLLLQQQLVNLRCGDPVQAADGFVREQ